MHHNLWFHDFIKLLLTIQTIEDSAILEEIEITIQLGKENLATCIGYNDEIYIWAIR
jgi:hypothetical protein